MREGLGVCLLAAVAWWGISAPVPRARPKPAPPAFPAGSWRVSWGGTDCVMRLSAFGNYECHFAGQYWYGTWKYRPDARTLTVTETSLAGETFDWSLTLLDGRRSGSAVRPATGEHVCEVTLEEAAE